MRRSLCSDSLSLCIQDKSEPLMRDARVCESDGQWKHCSRTLRIDINCATTVLRGSQLLSVSSQFDCSVLSHTLADGAAPLPQPSRVMRPSQSENSQSQSQASMQQQAQGARMHTNKAEGHSSHCWASQPPSQAARREDADNSVSCQDC